jgi:hypothetical protein
VTEFYDVRSGRNFIQLLGICERACEVRLSAQVSQKSDAS